MNVKVIGKIVGKIMILEGILMFFPFVVSIIYKENYIYILSFLIPSCCLIIIGKLLQLLKPSRKGLYQKEGFAVCALTWIVMTIFGALPFVINQDIPNYIDALFETMSGFTTTGASIVPDITQLAHSSLFWRSFTHWIGGMGILVFILIFIPESEDGSSLHLLKAESPGPQVGNLASKMKMTTRILYLIYLGLTIIEVILLLFSPKQVASDGTVYQMDLFNSLLTAFGSAGTGGFGFVTNSMEYFSAYSQYVIATFLILFGVNFSLYYLILIGKCKEAFKSEELRTYLMIIVISVFIICFNVISNQIDNLQSLGVVDLEEIFRHSYFQVASIITTTGYSTTNYEYWPELSKCMILILMLLGAMAGSTGGGIKISRLVISFKGIFTRIRKLINPRYVSKTKFEGKILEETTTNDVFAFITLYFFLTFIIILILSCDPINGTVVNVAGKEVTHGFVSNFSATISCLSNIGPGLEAVGPYGSFNLYNHFSKIVLTFAMLIGRLEILPVLILFTPKTWKK